MIERESAQQELQVARRIQQASLPKEVPILGGVATASGSSSPGEVLARVNAAVLARIPPNMFVTCFYGVLDPESGHFSYANAGHNLPCCCHDHTAPDLRATGMPLGL